MEISEESETQVWCRHDQCHHGQYSARAFYKATSQLCHHEKIIEEHPCFQHGKCKQCNHWKDQMRSATKQNRQYYCRHIKCTKRFAHPKSLSRHEGQEHNKEFCGKECERCKEVERRRNLKKIKHKHCDVCEIEKIDEEAEEQRKKQIDILTKILEGLKNGEDLSPKKDRAWQEELRASELNLREHLLIVEKPRKENNDKGAIIPVEVLEAQFRNWWETINSCVLTEEPSSDTRALQGNLQCLTLMSIRITSKRQMYSSRCALAFIDTWSKEIFLFYTRVRL